MKLFIVSVILISVISCRGVSTLHVYPEGQGLKQLSKDEAVYLTKSKEAPACNITKIADVRIASKTYGGASRVNEVLRNMAREKGGNAVINYNFWIAPNGGAFAAPHCEGTIVFSDLSCLKMHTVSTDNPVESNLPATPDR